MILSVEKAKTRYGEIVNGVWADEVKWCSALQIPAEISTGWTNSASNAPTSHIYCNRDMAPALMRVLNSIKAQGLEKQLLTFDGCYMVRDVRSRPGSLSCHAYALAIDINAGFNPLGGPSALSLELVKCFEDQGFAWGGSFSRCDPMHFSFGWE